MKAVSSLHENVKSGDVSAKKDLIQAGADVNSEDDIGYTPLMLASENKHPLVVKLLSRGCDVESADRKKMTALHDSVESGDVDITEALIEAGADVNRKYRFGYTPLMLALENKHPAVVKLLLSRGCDVKAVDRKGWTALHYSAGSGNVVITEALIEAGADVNRGDKRRRTPLLLAVENKHPAVAKLLLSRGCDVEALGWRERKALHYSAKYGDVDITEALIEAGADVNRGDKCGYTPLKLAVKNKHPAVVKLLLSCGCDVEVVDMRGRTALYYSAKSGDVDITEALIEAGADVNRGDEYGYTPLMLAVKNKHSAVVKLLLSRGCDVKAVDSWWERTALHNSAESGDVVITEALIEAGADVNRRDMLGDIPLMLAVENKHPAVYKLLLSCGSDMLSVSHVLDVYLDKRTTLHYSAKSGDVDITETLIDAGLDVNRKDKRGDSPLMLAVKVKHPAVVKFLLSLGCEVEAVDRRGRTVLHYSAESGDVDITEALIEAGADVNRGDEYGDTPLMLAMKNKHPAVIKLLLSRGCDVEAVDRWGRAALQYSTGSYDVGITVALIKAAMNRKDKWWSWDIPSGLSKGDVQYIYNKLSGLNILSQKVKYRLLAKICEPVRLPTLTDFLGILGVLKTSSFSYKIFDQQISQYLSSKTNDQRRPPVKAPVNHTLYEGWRKKIRMNFATIVQNLSYGIDNIINSIYDDDNISVDEFNTILKYENNKDKTRKLLLLLLDKPSDEWIPGFLRCMQETKGGIYLFKLIKNTNEDLGRLDQMQLWEKYENADNMNQKARVLKESIRQNRAYLRNQLGQRKVHDINMRMFSQEELECIRGQMDYKAKVEAGLICLLGRKEVGWVLPFIDFISNRLGNQCLRDVFGNIEVLTILAN